MKSVYGRNALKSSKLRINLSFNCNKKSFTLQNFKLEFLRYLSDKL